MDVADLFKAHEAAKKRTDSEQAALAPKRLKSDPAQSQIDKIVAAGEKLPASIDLPQLKRILLRFEKAAARNRELRVRHADEPLRYLESETDLAQEIKAMTAISAAPELYPQLVSLGSHASILSLLAHENTDIAVEAVALIDELTDDDSVALTDEEAAAGARALVKALVEQDALVLLVQNIRRLDEDKSDEKEGVFKSLSVVENFVNIDPSLVENAADASGILQFILTRIAAKTFDSVRQYAAELLAILLHLGHKIRRRICDLGGIDTLLRVLAPYRKRDPKDADETEMMENFFDALCVCLSETHAKEKFVEAEGFELMILMMKERLMSRSKAIKTIDHALQNTNGPALAARFIEALGLKSLFSCFTKKHAKKYKKQYPEYSSREEDEHLVSIIASLFRALSPVNPQSNEKQSSSDPSQPDQSDAFRAYRERLLFKLIESDFEKTNRLITLYQEYSERMNVYDDQLAVRLRRAQERREMRRRRMASHDDDDDEDEALLDDPATIYLDRLENGLFTLQLVAIILARSCYESHEICEYARSKLDVIGISSDDITEILKEYADNYGEINAEDENQDDHDAKNNSDGNPRQNDHEEERTFLQHLAYAFLMPPQMDEGVDDNASA